MATQHRAVVMIINRLQPIVRWTLAIILMFAGAAKLVQTDAFARTLADTGFLTTAEAAVTAVALPAAETTLARLPRCRGGAVERASAETPPG